MNRRNRGFTPLRKNAFITILSVLILSAGSGCTQQAYHYQSEACPNRESGHYANAVAVKGMMDNLVKQIPGAAISIWSSDGYWEYAAGYAQVEAKTPMSNCHLQYLQSVAKTYAAVCVLKLAEQGKIDLEAPITRYLPAAYSASVTRADEITVKMLLNHTSGIPEYNDVPRYITRLLQAPDHPFKPVDYLDYIRGRPLDFEPGTKYSYRNSNYLIVALLVDAVTGNHGAFMKKEIFDPLGLEHTFYYGDAGYLNYPRLVNTYWDRYSVGRVENVSVLQRNNVRAMIGDDGIVATPHDAVAFLKALMEGKLIGHEMLSQMKSWVNDAQGNATYGLGLDKADYGAIEAWGHSGGGIGAGCQLYYLPEKELYFFIAINLGTVTESPLHQEVQRGLTSLLEITQR